MALRDAAQDGRRPRAIIYLRMSIDRTGEGAGIERQEQACRALCLARGWDVVMVVEDTMSATKWRLEDRPGWQKARDAVEAGEADYIVAWHLDRVTRSMKDLESLIELAIDRNIGLATATGDIDLTNDVGRMVARILAAVAAGEQERKAERQILEQDQRVAAGIPNWIRLPFGYNADMTVREDEAALVEKAYRDVARGKRMATICQEWNEAGYRTSAPEPRPDDPERPRAPRKQDYNPTGEWGVPALRRLLRSPRNMGKITLYEEIMGDGQWPAIIDESTWLRAQEVLDRNSEVYANPNAGKQTYLLSGLAECGKCGGKVITNKAPNGAPWRIYVCGGVEGKPEAGTGHTSIPIDFADDLIVNRLVMQMDRTGRRTFHSVPDPVNVEPLKTREREIEGLMAELVEDRTQGLIDRAAMLAGTARLRAELVALQAEIARAGSATFTKEVDIENAFEEFGALDLGEQRTILAGAFEFIRLPGRGRGRAPKGLPSWRPEHLLSEFTAAWSTTSEGHEEGKEGEQPESEPKASQRRKENGLNQ
ncbi:recombinase family protein [Catenuloplanes sp. NPDC051500]|uniref:recombinase family protein n=1 Tax=Catenuloplanes sp. NPDC051500 TaxID=3363959 RepID=UPI0037AAD37B